MKKHVVVIGGGMSGTAAAHELIKYGYDVTIIEKDSRLGGRMCTETIDGLISEMGAGFLMGMYTNTLAFLREARLETKLIRRKSAVYIVRDNTQHGLRKASTIVGTRWLSFGAKFLLVKEVLQALPKWRLLDIHTIWHDDRVNEKTVSDHLNGKYGRELVDYALGPALNSYFYYSPKQTSYALILALFRVSLSLTGSHTYIMQDGLRQIPEAAAQGCEVLLSTKVDKVVHRQNGRFDITIRGTAEERILTADGVVCATTASAVPKIITCLSSAQRDFFSRVEYSSTSIAAYCVERSTPPRTYAISHPREATMPLAAITVSSDLSPRADSVKLYGSGSMGTKLCTMTDEAIEACLSKAASLDMSNAQANKTWRVKKWKEAIPKFSTEHLVRLQSFARGDIEDKAMALTFAGDYIGGPLIEGAFTSGIQAAERLHNRLYN